MKDKSLLLGVANYLNQKTTLNIWLIRGIIILATIFFAFYVIPFYFFVGLILFLYSRNKCLYCGKEMNGKKGFCSNCGKKKIPFKQGLLKVAIIFISLVVLILLFAFILPENNSNLESKDLLNQTNISSNFYNESLTPQDSEIEEVNLTINLNKISSIDEISDSFCGISSEDLVILLGKPLYAIDWEKSSTGQTLEPKSFKFIFQNYSVISKGEYNSTSKKIETYQIMVREDNEESRKLIKYIDCKNL